MKRNTKDPRFATQPWQKTHYFSVWILKTFCSVVIKIIMLKPAAIALLVEELTSDPMFEGLNPAN
jgi:hypothetical protein